MINSSSAVLKTQVIIQKCFRQSSKYECRNVFSPLEYLQRTGNEFSSSSSSSSDSDSDGESPSGGAAPASPPVSLEGVRELFVEPPAVEERPFDENKVRGKSVLLRLN
jgi:hypothetical protein